MLLKRLFQQSIQSWTGRVSLSTTSVPSLLISPSFVPSHPFFFQSPIPPIPFAGLPAVLLNHRSLSQM